MPFVAAGLLVLVLLILMGRGYFRIDRRSIGKNTRFMGGVLLALATAALAMTGRVDFAFLTAVAAWFCFFGTMPPWLGGPAQPLPRGEQKQAPPPPAPVAMSRAEALKVLGLQDGASEEEIRAAHRRLIQQTHPDKGGTSYLAAKINEAKDVLLRRK